jgi:hypothetical protein
MTFGPSRLALNEIQPAAPRRLPRPAAPALARQATLPPPDTLALGRALDDLTRRPVVAQRQAVQAPLRAAALARQEEGQVRQRRAHLEASLEGLGAAPERPVQPSAAPVMPTQPQTPGQWAAALRERAGEVEGRPLDARQAAQFTALQRQVAQTLAQGFRQDRRAPEERYSDYGDHLATLQRHPVSAPVAGVVLGLVPAAERPALQRAAAEGLERQLAHEEALTRDHSRQTVQRQLAELDAEAGRPLLERIQARRGAGNPLPEGVRRHLETGLNHDLSRVRIHDDAEAHKLAKGVRALAFTAGTDIFFRRGHFDPDSRSGLELLAHEVTHTVQQSRGQVGGGVDPDAGLEAEARTMGAKLAQAMPNTVMPSAKSLLPPVSRYTPGVYTPAAATARVQAGAAQHFALKPLHDLQPHSVQRFDLGGALGAAWDATGGKVVEKGKELVASGLKVIPGYKELCLAFGRDLVTGNAVVSSAESILTALTNWVPGPLKDILRALRETNVIGKAWEWFKGELGKLDLAGALGEIASAIGKADLGAATSAVTRRISGVKNLVVGSARKIAEIGLTALTAGLGPLGKQIMAKLKGAGDVIVQVLKDPVKFARNLISAVGGGFKAFGSNAPKHLQNGIGQWLTGASGITFPASFSLEGVFMTALSVMGLTYQTMRGKLVRALGPGGADKVGKAESTVQALQVMKGGLQHASEMKGEQGSVGKAVQDGVKSEVTKSLVLTGIQKVVTMLVPGGGFINAVIGAFQTVQTIVQQAAQIGQVVTNALGSVAAVAAGNISGAAGLIDRALGGAIPVALAWLGKLVGLGNLGGKIRNVINKVRGRLDRVVDKIVAKVKGIIEKALGKGKADGKLGDDRDTPNSAKVKADVRAYLASRLPKSFKTTGEVSAVLRSTYAKFQSGGLKALKTQRKGLNFSVLAKASPFDNVGITQAEIMFDLDDIELMTRRRGVALKASINGIKIESSTNTPGKKGELPKHAEENFVLNAQKILTNLPQRGQGAKVVVQLSSSPCGDPGCDTILAQKLHNCASTLIDFAKTHKIDLSVQVLGLYTPNIAGGKALSKAGIQRMLEAGIRVETWTPDQAIRQIESQSGELDPAAARAIRSKVRNALKALEDISGLNLGGA